MKVIFFLYLGIIFLAVGFGVVYGIASPLRERELAALCLQNLIRMLLFVQAFIFYKTAEVIAGGNEEEWACGYRFGDHVGHYLLCLMVLTAAFGIWFYDFLILEMKPLNIRWVGYLLNVMVPFCVSRFFGVVSVINWLAICSVIAFFPN